MCETNICRYYVLSGGFWRCLKKGDRRNCVLCEWEGYGLDSDDPCRFFQEETCKYILNREDQIMKKTRTQTIRSNSLFKKLIKDLQEIGRELFPSNNEEDEKIAYNITHYNGYCIDELLPYPWDMESVKLIQDEEGQGILFAEKNWAYMIRPKLICKFYDGKKCIHYRIGGKNCNLDGYEGECESFQEPCRLAGKFACEEEGEPKIQVKIKGEDPDLIPLLQKSGNARLIKGFVLYEPELDKEKGFVIPEIIRQKEKIFCIHVSEMYTKESRTTIVCGLSGKTLRPYHIPSVGLHCCTTHASIHSYFSVPLQIITIDYTKKDSEITIYHHQILSDGDIVYLEKKVVWEGHYKDLPKKYEKYMPAVNAAVKKANCYLVHYSFSNTWES